MRSIGSCSNPRRSRRCSKDSSPTESLSEKVEDVVYSTPYLITEDRSVYEDSIARVRGHHDTGVPIPPHSLHECGRRSDSRGRGRSCRQDKRDAQGPLPGTVGQFGQVSETGPFRSDRDLLL